MLTVRLATTSRDIEAAQALRHAVFRSGASARVAGRAEARCLDADRYDPLCDHLIAETHAGCAGSQVIGTYRLLRQDAARTLGGFYSCQEFDIRALLETHSHLEFLELGRSCVHPDWRTRNVIERLWQGIWEYVRTRRIGAMFGCASFPGTDPVVLAEPLSYLAHTAEAPAGWTASALPHRYQRMDILTRGYYDERRARRLLPPLIKAYLRAGAHVGDGAVVDHEFGTTDVLVILPVANIAARYVDHFTPNRTGRDQPLIS